MRSFQSSNRYSNKTASPVIINLKEVPHSEGIQTDDNTSNEGQPRVTLPQAVRGDTERPILKPKRAIAIPSTEGRS